MAYRKLHSARMRAVSGACSALIAATAAGAFLAAQDPAPRLRFEITLPAGIDTAAVDGRVFVVVSNDQRTEPRLTIDSPPDAQPFFAVNVDALRAGQRVT